MLCDNKSAISIAHDPVYHDLSKHVDNRFCMKEKLEEKTLSDNHIYSTEQCADIFTQGLPMEVFSRLVSKLGMNSIHSYA